MLITQAIEQRFGNVDDGRWEQIFNRLVQIGFVANISLIQTPGFFPDGTVCLPCQAPTPGTAPPPELGWGGSEKKPKTVEKKP